MRVRGRDGAEEGDRFDGGPAAPQDPDAIGGAAGLLQCLLVGGECSSLKFRCRFPGNVQRFISFPGELEFSQEK